MRQKILALCLLLAMALGLSAKEEWCPKRISDNTYVNDFSKILADTERDSLERRIQAFIEQTSNQILVVITPTLHGDDIMDVGQRIGRTWGIGQAELNNGVVILIKSKTEAEPNGDVAICTGYGLEGALPDAFCKEITEDMVAPLRELRYFDAITRALDVLEPVCKGEYNYERYKSDHRPQHNGLSDSAANKITWGVMGGGLLAMILYMRRKKKKAVAYRAAHPEEFTHRDSDGNIIDDDDDDYSSSSYDDNDDDSYDTSYGGGDFGGGGAHSGF